MSQQRPVYVPKRKRQQKQPLRLHGAFQGGFSAGYFNTVDTPEGWAPQQSQQQSQRQQQQPQSTTKNSLHHDGISDYYADGSNAAASSKQQQQQQRPEDFMDEQDHNEWGGPVQVKAAYKTTATKTKTAAATDTATSAVDSSINDLFSVSVEPKHSKNIGQQLLERLGWRPNKKEDANGTSASSFTAYVPINGTAETEDAKDHTHIIRLSNKRLRKIVQSQTAVAVPSPKFQNNDAHVGLGYDAYRNAPEFRRAREQRQRAARQRARAATTASSQRGAYRVSSVLPGGVDDDDEDEDDHNARGATAADIAAAETVADFVGRKSTAGFALHDDEDDAYDDDDDAVQHSSGLSLHAVMGNGAQKQSDDKNQQRRKLGVDSETYDTVAYEHNSSGEEEDDHQHPRKKHAPSAVVHQFGAALSSWATAKDGKHAQHQHPSRRTTSDGLPPLSGFVVGGTGDVASSSSSSSRPYFRGPDVPTDWNYEDRGGHAFFENEHPAVIAALARAEELQATQTRQQTAYQQALERAQVKPTLTTTNSNIQPQQSKEQPQKHSVFAGVGAAMKSRFTSASITDDSDDKGGLRQQPSDADVSSRAFFTRTVHPFAPVALLCKRLGVAAPESSSSGTALVVHRTREEAYFEDEILPAAAHAKKQQQQQEARSSDSKNGSSSSERKTPAQALLEELSGPVAAGDESTSGRLEDAAPNRAVLAVYKSIFEPNADEQSSSSSSSDGEEEEGKEDTQKLEQKGSERQLAAKSDDQGGAGVAAGAGADAAVAVAAASSSTALVPFDEDDDRRRRKREKSGKKSRSRKRSRSPSRDGEHRSKKKKKERKKEDRKRHRRHEKKSKSKKSRHRRSDSGSSEGSVRERKESG